MWECFFLQIFFSGPLSLLFRIRLLERAIMHNDDYIIQTIQQIKRIVQKWGFVFVTEIILPLFGLCLVLQFIPIKAIPNASTMCSVEIFICQPRHRFKGGRHLQNIGFHWVRGVNYWWFHVEICWAVDWDLLLYKFTMGVCQTSCWLAECLLITG